MIVIIVPKLREPQVRREHAAATAGPTACCRGGGATRHAHGRGKPQLGLPSHPGGVGESGGHQIDKLTVRNILRRHHMEPAPQRRKGGMGWTQFLKLHWEVMAATDFFTVEVATWHGLMTYYVLVVMELATRRVHISGITPHPTAAFMQQCARQLTDPCEGFLLGKRYLIHDRDTRFTQAFDGLLKASSVEPIVLPPRSPNLNAHCERFVRSIKEEALAQMVLLGERSLSYAIQQYLAHYHYERNHQGLDNQLIAPEPEQNYQGGAVLRRDRLGGLLRYYYREAA